MSNDPFPLRPGDPSSLGGYRIRGRLGRGGMGTVHLAHAPAGRAVALKVAHPDLADDEDFCARFVTDRSGPAPPIRNAPFSPHRYAERTSPADANPSLPSATPDTNPPEPHEVPPS